MDCSRGLESSHGCLQPRGDSFMRRSSIDGIMGGCIPVFFHRASTLEAQYRWHEPAGPGPGGRSGHRGRYYVLLNADDVLEGRVDIEEELSRYTDKQVAAMREELITMILRFLHSDPG